jgi:hypothetical protein
VSALHSLAFSHSRHAFNSLFVASQMTAQIETGISKLAERRGHVHVPSLEFKHLGRSDDSCSETSEFSFMNGQSTTPRTPMELRFSARTMFSRGSRKTAVTQLFYKLSAMR